MEKIEEDILHYAIERGFMVLARDYGFDFVEDVRLDNKKTNQEYYADIVYNEVIKNCKEI